MHADVDLQDYGRFCLPLQAKVYGMTDTSSQHGEQRVCFVP